MNRRIYVTENYFYVEIDPKADIKCAMCKSPAIYFESGNGEPLCEKCVMNNEEARLKK